MANSKVILSDTCPVCCQKASAPFRVYDERGNVVHGCVDEFHTDHLVRISASNHWHHRPESKKLRAGLKKMRDGYITRAA